MHPNKLSVFLLVTVVSSISAAPLLIRLRRAAEESSQNPLTEEDTTSSSRQAKAIEFNNVAELSQDKSNEREGKLKKKPRKNKALAFFDFIPQFYTGEDEYDTDDDLVLDPYSKNQEEDLSRTIPSRRKPNPYKNIGNTNALSYENSPIFYIRLPPTPYMFVPGLGYISQPPSLGPPVPPPVNPFINLPIDFVSNGKPTNVYQWSGAPTYQSPAVDPFSQIYNQPISRPLQRPNDFGYQRPSSIKKPQTDSKVTNLKKGPYTFNGKPNDSVFVLRDSYNSLYSDALQNFYP